MESIHWTASGSAARAESSSMQTVIEPDRALDFFPDGDRMLRGLPGVRSTGSLRGGFAPGARAWVGHALVSTSMAPARRTRRRPCPPGRKSMPFGQTRTTRTTSVPGRWRSMRASVMAGSALSFSSTASVTSISKRFGQAAVRSMPAAAGDAEFIDHRIRVEVDDLEAEIRILIERVVHAAPHAPADAGEHGEHAGDLGEGRAARKPNQAMRGDITRTSSTFWRVAAVAGGFVFHGEIGFS
jgi:hypothetical protein